MKNWSNEMWQCITSTHNIRIKNIQKLRTKARERKLQHLFIIEGIRELNLALTNKYSLDSVYICSKFFKRTNDFQIIHSISPNILYEVSENIFQKITYRENSNGILALAKPKSHLLTDLNLSDNPFIIILESIEKPGNLGAILRTTEAAGADAIIICNSLTDIYNPNVIRSSIGCLFTVPIAISTNEETFAFLKHKHIQIFATELITTQWYWDTNFTSHSAIVMGTEANGLTDFWLNHADQRIKIPMQGAADSLNVSVSTAIITFEAMRQRNVLLQNQNSYNVS